MKIGIQEKKIQAKFFFETKNFFSKIVIPMKMGENKIEAHNEKIYGRIQFSTDYFTSYVLYRDHPPFV